MILSLFLHRNDHTTRLCLDVVCFSESIVHDFCISCFDGRALWQPARYCLVSLPILMRL
jgi:hypothetical protein